MLAALEEVNILMMLKALEKGLNPQRLSRIYAISLRFLGRCRYFETYHGRTGEDDSGKAKQDSKFSDYFENSSSCASHLNQEVSSDSELSDSETCFGEFDDVRDMQVVSSDSDLSDVGGDDVKLSNIDDIANFTFGERMSMEMVSRVEKVEVAFRDPLVKEVCRMIEQRHVWSAQMEGEMRNLLRSLKPHQVCAVIKLQKDERVALNFFYWADRQWRYRHDVEVYYTMLEVLSKTKLCKGAKRVYRLMTRRGIKCEPRAFRYLMISYSRAGKTRSAMRILTIMQKAGSGPDILVCNTALNVIVKENKLTKALSFVERMERVDIKPDVITYNILVRGLCVAHRLDEALEMIKIMPSKGCSPDKVSYYTVMSFLCKEKRVGEVRELLLTMEKDHNLVPDQVTYYTLIHVLSKHGHADEALKFSQEAEKKGFLVDKVGYSAIVHAFSKEGRMDEAQEIVNKMFQKGCIPDVVTYTAVVNGFCRIGKVDQAKSLIQQMYKHGLRPNTVSYTALLNGLCKLGNSLEARNMLNSSEEEWWTPNAITYSAVMHGFRREGKLTEACDLVGDMLKKGFYPTPVEINQLIQDLCREGKVDDAKNFFEGCIIKGCSVNVFNFTTLIHGFCKKGDIESALSLLDDMYLSNKHADVVTYTTLVDALSKVGRFEEATKLIYRMLRRGIYPTPVTFRTVIHRYCEGNKVDNLIILLERMQKSREFKTAYNLTIEKLCKFGRLEEAYKLLGKILRTSSKIDIDTCNVLIDSGLKKGTPLLSYNVACRMLIRNTTPDVKLCSRVSKKLASNGNHIEAQKLIIKLVERGHLSPQMQ